MGRGVGGLRAEVRTPANLPQLGFQFVGFRTSGPCHGHLVHGVGLTSPDSAVRTFAGVSMHGVGDALRATRKRTRTVALPVDAPKAAQAKEDIDLANLVTEAPLYALPPSHLFVSPRTKIDLQPSDATIDSRGGWRVRAAGAGAGVGSRDGPFM